MFKQRSSKSRFLKRKLEQRIKELERDQAIQQIISEGNSNLFPHGIEDNQTFQVLDNSLPAANNRFQNTQQCDNRSGSHINSLVIEQTDESEFDDYNFCDQTSDSDLNDQTNYNSQHGIDNELEEEGWEEVIENVDLPNEDLEKKQSGFPKTDNSLNEHSFQGKLRIWALKHNVNQNAISGLLRILKPCHPDLPLDGRTLLKTCRSSNVTPFQNDDNSKMCYFGIEKELQKFDLKTLCVGNIVSLKVNIDGLQIYNSTGAQFWPILCQIVCEKKYTSPFPTLVYYGTRKPNSLSEFFEPFIKEINTLSTVGFKHQGEVYHVKIHCLLCDAPARSFIKAIKSHTGYYGCEKCTQKGQPLLNRIVFPDLDAPKRTDESFAQQTQEDHHIGVSPLLNLNVGLVSQVPLDSMHLVYLGVVKKVILCFIRNGARSVRIGGHQISMISERLVNLRKNIPRDFSRKPRSMKYIDRWKATELRQFCLYTGPVVLRNILPEAQYKNFLLLHVAISILSNPIMSSNERYISYAEGLLKVFIQDLATIYGAHTTVYNVHNLTHLADDVRKFGCIDDFSCFPFESFLGQLKRQLRTPNRCLEQLSKRMSEQYSTFEEVPLPAVLSLRSLHHRGPCMGIAGDQFREVIFNGSVISTKIEGDGFLILKSGKIGRVLNIIKTEEADPNSDNVFLILEEVPQEGDFYNFPCSSQHVGIFKIKRIRADSPLFSTKLKMVHKKCIVSEINNVAIVLNHGIY